MSAVAAAAQRLQLQCARARRHHVPTAVLVHELRARARAHRRGAELVQRLRWQHAARLRHRHRRRCEYAGGRVIGEPHAVAGAVVRPLRAGHSGRVPCERCGERMLAERDSEWRGRQWEAQSRLGVL